LNKQERLLIKPVKTENFSAIFYNKEILVLASAAVQTVRDSAQQQKAWKKPWEIDDVMNHLSISHSRK
jgi:hypothetical protein